MSPSTIPSNVAEGTLAPLLCSGCGAALPVVDAPESACAFCHARTPVPEAHREALRLTRAEGAAVARANVAWGRFTRLALPRPLEIALMTAPAVWFWGGLVAGAIAAWSGAVPGALVPQWMGLGVWLPVEGMVMAMTLAYWLGVPHAQIDLARTALAAKPGKDGGPPACRQCGAPLDAPTEAAFSRCVYCQTDSLLHLPRHALDAIDDRTARAHASAEEALREFERFARETAGSVRAMGLAVSVPIAFLCLWSFVPAVRGWFIVNVLLVLLVAFLGMVVNAGVVGAVETPRPPRPTDAQGARANEEDGAGALGAGGLFLAPALFLATAAGAFGWWRGHAGMMVLGGAIFLLPALGLIVLGIAQAVRYSRPRVT